VDASGPRPAERCPEQSAHRQTCFVSFENDSRVMFHIKSIGHGADQLIDVAKDLVIDLDRFELVREGEKVDRLAVLPEDQLAFVGVLILGPPEISTV